MPGRDLVMYGLNNKFQEETTIIMKTTLKYGRIKVPEKKLNQKKQKSTEFCVTNSDTFTIL